MLFVNERVTNMFHKLLSYEDEKKIWKTEINLFIHYWVLKE